MVVAIAVPVAVIAFFASRFSGRKAIQRLCNTIFFGLGTVAIAVALLHGGL